MSTPNGQQEPYEQDPPQPSRQEARQPSQPQAGQDTYAPEEDIPRQQAPREDQYAGPGPGQGQQVPGQGTGWDDGRRGTYGAYPPAGGYDPARAGQQLSYLDGASVDFPEALRGAIHNVFTYRGRASRSAFWWFALVAVIAYLVVSWVSDESWVAGVILDVFIGLPMLLTSIALAVRRLHDSDRSGWWWWIGFVPVVGGIILLVFYLLPGTRGPNRFNVTRY
jgi:uncharacterized membrane protein YhaH (DUF805 family)